MHSAGYPPGYVTASNLHDQGIGGGTLRGIGPEMRLGAPQVKGARGSAPPGITNPMGFPPQGMTHDPVYIQNWQLIQMGRSITERLDFVYDHDLDENGLFAYLRKTSRGLNPAYPGPHQSIKMFTSSVKLGFPECLLLHEERSDFKTMNQAYSYIGFELLGGRRLIPSCYTIRNCVGQDPENETSRQSQLGSTLLNWHFEGSNDMLTWTILDKRIHYPENHILRHPPSLEVQGLTRKGAVSTWGMDPEKMSEWERAQGFKYFRIV